MIHVNWEAQKRSKISFYLWMLFIVQVTITIHCKHY